MTLHLLAPAKLNLTLEVIRKREDGYHEIASIMQTIDLADRVTISAAPDLQLIVSGPEARGVPEDPKQNLAYRAAIALQETTDSSNLGARIELEKRIRGGAGLGGGSSDAAAVLRGLSRLWGLSQSEPQLDHLAASLGSDVSFFLRGGTALSTGRGEVIKSLADLPEQQCTLFVSTEDLSDKTSRMYAALTPADFSDGAETLETAEALKHGDALPVLKMRNAFDRALAEMAPRAGEAMRVCREAGLPVLAAGAGPSFFSLTHLGLIHSSLISALESEYGVAARACRTLTAAEALGVRDLMSEVFAGFVCGFLLSAVSAPLFAAALLRMRTSSSALARMLPAGVNAVSVTMTLHFALLFFWTGLGLILGLVLLAMDGGDAALGSLNAPYTLFVFSIVLALSAPFALLIVTWRRYILANAAASFLVFGYLLPYMAEWSKFD